jgi:soluble lytic murein transglycosylase-like protein
MTRWNNEDAYDAAVRVASQNFAVPFELIKAVIAQESRFNPNAVRTEAALADKSAGLMQVLYSTAKGEGFTGTFQELFDPLANITFGTSFLASMLQRSGGNIPRAVSAYNGGYRPQLGFGEVATKPVVICLARDAAGKCISTRSVGVGEFGNQPYVNAVLSNYDYFRAKATPPQSPVMIGASPSIPLDDAHRDYTESETGGRDRRTPVGVARPTFWKTVITLCKLLWDKWEWKR